MLENVFIISMIFFFFLLNSCLSCWIHITSIRDARTKAFKMSGRLYYFFGGAWSQRSGKSNCRKMSTVAHSYDVHSFTPLLKKVDILVKRSFQDYYMFLERLWPTVNFYYYIFLEMGWRFSFESNDLHLNYHLLPVPESTHTDACWVIQTQKINKLGEIMSLKVWVVWSY